MRTRRNIMIVFIIGLLLMGIGSGIAFSEFTSFHYGGVKNLGGEKTNVTLTQTLPETITQVQLLTWGYFTNQVRIEPDASLAPDQMVIDITCNETLITPYIVEAEEASANHITYALEYYYHGPDDEMADFLKVKDEVLMDIKNRVIYTYSTDYVDNITVKASPELVRRLEIR